MRHSVLHEVFERLDFDLSTTLILIINEASRISERPPRLQLVIVSFFHSVQKVILANDLEAEFSFNCKSIMVVFIYRFIQIFKRFCWQLTWNKITPLKSSFYIYFPIFFFKRFKRSEPSPPTQSHFVYTWSKFYQLLKTSMLFKKGSTKWQIAHFSNVVPWCSHKKSLFVETCYLSIRRIHSSTIIQRICLRVFGALKIHRLN